MKQHTWAVADIAQDHDTEAAPAQGRNSGCLCGEVTDEAENDHECQPDDDGD